MNFKQLLKLTEEAREKADSFRTTGEAMAKERAKDTAPDDKAKDAARKRAERSKKVPHSRQSKSELVKNMVIVKTKSGTVQIIFKDSLDKSKHDILSKGESINFEEAKKISTDPKFEQTTASKLLLGNVKKKESKEKEKKKPEEKSEKPSAKKETEENKKEKGKEKEGEEEEPRKLNKQEMFNAMQQMSAEQLAMLPPEVRDDYFKKLRSPPTNSDFDNSTFEGLSVKFGISPISSLPFNQQVLNALLFLTKLKVGAGEQEMQTFAAMNPGASEFTKKAYLQATKILSQIGDECLNNLLSASDVGQRQIYKEGSVDMQCGDYRFKIEAGGEFTVSTDKLNQSNKLFRGLLSNALNKVFSDPKIISSDPGIKKMGEKLEAKKQEMSTLLISNQNLPFIMQDENMVRQLQQTPVKLVNGQDGGFVLDSEGNLNPAANLEAWTGAIEKESRGIFKKDMDTEKSPVGAEVTATILKSYLRGDEMKKKAEQPTHVVTANGVFELSDAFIAEISKNAVLNVKQTENPIDSENLINYKKESLTALKSWRSLIEEKNQKPSLKDMLIDINKINPMQVAANHLIAHMDFEINSSLIPGFKPKDLNAVEYNYVRINGKVTKIPVDRTDRISNQIREDTYLFLNDVLIESLTNNFVLQNLIKVNLLDSNEARTMITSTLLNESTEKTNLKEILQKVIERAAKTPIKIALLEQFLLEKYKRNYKKEYKNYHGKPKQRKERAKRTKAREQMEKKGIVKKGDGKDIDHKTPLRSGGSNGINNLRVRNRSNNRADNGHKKGEKQSKDWK